MEERKNTRKQKNPQKTDRLHRRRPPRPPGPGRMPRVLRNAGERFRSLKKSVLIEELRDLLPPPPPDAAHRGHLTHRVMTTEAILRHSIHYMNILEDVLRQSKAIEHVASIMGNNEDTLQFVKRETAKLQKVLDFRVGVELIPTYGYFDPALKPYKRHEETLREAAELFQNHGWITNVRQRDQLGMTTNPSDALANIKSSAN